MKYNERIIKHNIDVPKLVPNGNINLTKIHYDKSVISHHPKSFEYYMIHGIVIDDIRYVVKEFFVRDNSVLAVVTPDENEYYEVVISNANSDEIDKLKKLIDELAKSKANQDIDLNLNDRTLTVGDKSVKLPTDLQQLSLRGNKLSISGGNSVTLPEYDDSSVKSRIEDLENRVDKDNQELSIVDDKLSIKNGNTVTLPKFNQDLNLSGRTLSISGGNSVTLPEDKDTVYDDSKLAKRITDLENKRDEDTVYDDSDVKRRISTLENKTDNFVSGVGVSREGNKVKLTYTFVDGTNKEVEFEDNDTKALAYDDTAIKSRVKALEDKPDNDKQALSLDDNKLKLTNGGEVDLSKYNTSVARYTNIPISTVAVPGAESVIKLDSLVNKYDVKDGDIIQDIVYEYSNSGELKFNYWGVSEIRGNSAFIYYLGHSKIYGYQNLKSDINNLKNITKSVHRFYNGDISGRAETNNVVTVNKSNFINPDDIKVGDTVEDYWADNNVINRGIWKVIEVNGDNVKIQGIGNYDTNIRRNLSFNNNTRVLSIGGVSEVTIPSDKQTITKQGNRLVLSNGGGEVELPTPKDSVPYDDKALRDRIKALEDKPTPTKQRLSLSGNTLSLTDGGSVTIPQGTAYNDADVKRRLTSLEGKADNDKQTLSFDNNTRSLSISNGNSVTIPSDKQTISKNGNKIVLSNGGGEVDIPTATPYNDADIKRRLDVLEEKPDNDRQILSVSGKTISISNGNSIDIPEPDLSRYVSVNDYNKVKGALEKLLTDLKFSGAWKQTGSTIFEGSLYINRHIATGNINVFGGTVDGNSFIRTSNNSTENDLAGGV